MTTSKQSLHHRAATNITMVTSYIWCDVTQGLSLMSDIGLLPQIGETPNMEEFPLSGNSSTLTSHLALLDYWSQPARPCWM